MAKTGAAKKVEKPMEKEEKIKLLKSYHFPKSIERLLEQQCEKETVGLCAAFVGNTGTNKRETIGKITDFLYKIGKLTNRFYTNLTLAEQNLEFFDQQLYSLVNVNRGVMFDKMYSQKAPFEAIYGRIAGQQHTSDENTKSAQTNLPAECRFTYNSGIEILVTQYRKKYIIINCTEKELKNFFDEDARLSYIFTDIIRFRDVTNLEITEIIMENLTNKKSINADMIKEWIDSSRYKFPFENRELALFVANYMNGHSNQFPKDIMRNDSSQEVLKHIIGLEPVKKQIDDLKAYLQFKYHAEKRGITLPSQSLHMMFLGNAGSGKTVVARIIAQVLYEIGICKENKLIEVSRKDLIGQYTGQTAPKTQSVINQAMNGVLFVDEAYSLVNGVNDSYGLECVATLIKAMEDYRNQLVVIFAGYVDEMTSFVNTNSGIQSRIGYTFYFPDYTVDELMQIYKEKITEFTVTEGHLEKISALLEFYHGTKNAGNGRLVDKILQNVLIKHAKMNGSLLELREEDVPTLEEIGETLYSRNRYIYPEMMNDEDYERVAIHEIGHALVAYHLEKDSGIAEISIKGQASGTLGYTSYKPNRIKPNYTRKDYENKICILLAGRAAESVVFGEEKVSAGCNEDIERATRICFSFAKTGFSETYGLARPDIFQTDAFVYGRMSEEIGFMLENFYNEARNYLEDHIGLIETLEDILIEKHIMSGEEMEHIIKEQEGQTKE